MSLDKGVPNSQQLRNAVYCKVPYGYQIDPEEDVLSYVSDTNGSCKG